MDDAGHTAQEIVPPTKLNRPASHELAPRYKIESELETRRVATSPKPRVRFGVTLPVNKGAVKSANRVASVLEAKLPTESYSTAEKETVPAEMICCSWAGVVVPRSTVIGTEVASEMSLVSTTVLPTLRSIRPPRAWFLVKFKIISMLLLVPFTKPATTLLPEALRELKVGASGATPSRM